MRSIGLIAALAILLAGCAAAPLKPMGEVSVDNFQRDEIRLWNRSLKERQKIDESGFLYKDADLSAYLNSVAQRLAPEGLAEKGLVIRVHVLKNPMMNAFAFPDGNIYVHTGILVKMENEAQMAALLAHEMSHSIYRHGMRSHRTLLKSTSMVSILYPIPIVNVFGAISAAASITGYSRDMEREADRLGYEAMVRAGYAPGEATKLFETMKKDIEDLEIKEPFFFGSHPRVNERIKNFNLFLKDTPHKPGRITGEERFIKAITPLFLENASLDLAIGRPKLAIKSLNKFLTMEPSSAEGHFMLGKAYCLNAEDGESEKAEMSFRKTAALDPMHAEAHRELGMMYMKRGNNQDAQKEFHEYLSLAPGAYDTKYIMQYLNKMELQNKEAK